MAKKQKAVTPFYTENTPDKSTPMYKNQGCVTGDVNYITAEIKFAMGGEAVYFTRYPTGNNDWRKEVQMATDVFMNTIDEFVKRCEAAEKAGQ